MEKTESILVARDFNNREILRGDLLRRRHMLEGTARLNDEDGDLYRFLSVSSKGRTSAGPSETGVPDIEVLINVETFSHEPRPKVETLPPTDFEVVLEDICLWYMPPGIIINYPSGFFYNNQVGGYACLHRVFQGVFKPIRDCVAFDQIEAHFTGPPYGGHCYSGITSATADLIDSYLADYDPEWKVDRSALAGSVEAWIYLRTSAPPRPRASGVGILTWQNSD